MFCPTIDCLKKFFHLQVRPLFDVGEKIAAASRRRKRKILGKLATPGKNSVTDFERAFSRLQFHLLVNEQKSVRVLLRFAKNCNSRTMHAYLLKSCNYCMYMVKNVNM